MRVLLIGANGYLGRYVADRLLADPAVQLTALGRGDDADVRFDLATGSPGALTRFLDAVHPGVVINCAGATGAGPGNSPGTTPSPSRRSASRCAAAAAGPGWCSWAAPPSTGPASPDRPRPRTPCRDPVDRTG